MPQSRVQTLRSSVKNARIGGLPGTLYLNFPDRQLGFIDPLGAPKDLVAIRYFSDATDYPPGDFVVQAGTVYRARGAVPAGPFNVAQWEPLLVGGVFVGDVPPEGPIPGQLWYESDSGALYVYYQDADSSQWVQVVGTQGAQGEGFVSTALELSLSYIPATTEAVQTQGYSAAGDGGGALYRRSVSEPAHAGKVQSADGGWWEITGSNLDARQFNAKGDSVTDDTVALQAAVDTAALLKARLTVSQGVYRINTAVNAMPFPVSGGIKIPSNSQLVFTPGAVLEEIPNDQPKRMLISLYAVENVVIEGPGALRGDRESHTYPNVFDTLAKLTAGTDYRTKDNYAADPPMWTDGKVAYVYQDGTPANNGIYTRSGGAWSKTGAYDPSLYVTHEFGVGINVYNSQRVWIRGLRISNFTGDGITVGNTSAGPFPAPVTSGREVFVSGNVIWGNRRQGLSIVDSDSVSVSGNKFRDIGLRQNMQDGTAPRAGIDIESGGINKTDNVSITDNDFDNCAGGALHQYDGNNVTIANNTANCLINLAYGVNTTVTGNALQGAGITGVGQRTPLAFTYTQAAGVTTCTFGAPHGLSTGSRAYFSFLHATNGQVASSGLYTVTVTSTTVLTLVTTYVSASGNGLAAYPANNNTISGNSIQNGTINVFGINVLVKGNTLHNPASYGVYVNGLAEDIVIAENIIDGTTAGIDGSLTASNVTIRGNDVRACSIVCIRAPFEKTMIDGNRVSDAPIGITVTDGRACVRGNYISIADYLLTTTGAIVANAAAVDFVEISDNTIEADKSDAIMTVTRPAVIMNNRILRYAGRIGLSMSGAGASGNLVQGNFIESNLGASGTSMGINVGAACDGARLIGNTLNARNAAYWRTVDTFSATNTRYTNNTRSGAFTKAATDTEVNTVAY